jgi:flagellar hook-associated protein FlgK
VRFLQIRHKSIFTGKNIEESIKDLLSNIGSFINTSRNDYDFTNTIYNEVYTKLQEVIGVDTNEEFTKILVFQKMLQSSSKYISIVNNIFDTLLGMLD